MPRATISPARSIFATMTDGTCRILPSHPRPTSPPKRIWPTRWPTLDTPRGRSRTPSRLSNEGDGSARRHSPIRWRCPPRRGPVRRSATRRDAATTRKSSSLPRASRRFPQYLALGRCMLGWLTARQGNVADGLGTLSEAIAALHSLGSRRETAYVNGLMADVLAWAGRQSEAIRLLDETLLASARTGAAAFDARTGCRKAAMLATGSGADVARRGSGIQVRDRYRTNSVVEAVRAAIVHRPRASLVAPGQARGSPRSPGTDPCLVHRRPDAPGSPGSARGACPVMVVAAAVCLHVIARSAATKQSPSLVGTGCSATLAGDCFVASLNDA